MKKSLAGFVSAVAIALVMFAPSKRPRNMDGDGAAMGSISTSARVTPTTVTAIRVTAMDTLIRIMAMDTHIRVTVTVDTIHTGVVTRGVTGGSGTSRAVVCERGLRT